MSGVATALVQVGKVRETGAGGGAGAVTKEERDTSNVTSRSELEGLVTD